MKRPTVTGLVNCTLTAALASCAPTPMDDRAAMRGIERAENSVGAPHNPITGEPGDAPALIINNTRVPWPDILPALAEAGGSDVIQEIMLDAALAEELHRRQITISEREIQTERERFLSAAAIAGDESERSLEALRRSRGLGPVRFNALLRRTAMLRALVRDRVVVNDAAITRAYNQRAADRYDIRVLVTRTASECERALDRIRAGDSFADLAARQSIDASAKSGGLLLAVTAEDLAWPQAIRTALPAMSVGEVRGPIAVEQGWTLLKLERITTPPPPPSLQDIRAELIAALRIEQERLLMEAESRRLIAGLSVSADQRLRWALQSTP